MQTPEQLLVESLLSKMQKERNSLKAAKILEQVRSRVQQSPEVRSPSTSISELRATYGIGQSNEKKT